MALNVDLNWRAVCPKFRFQIFDFLGGISLRNQREMYGVRIGVC